MAPLQDEWEKDDDDDNDDERETPPWVTETDYDDSSTTVSPDIVLSIVSPPVPYTVMGSITPTNSAFGPGFTGVIVPPGRPPLPSIRPGGYPSDRPWPPYELSTSTTESWQTSTSATAPYADHWASSSLWTTSTSTWKANPEASQSLTNPYGGRPPDWNSSRKHANNAPMYAVAAIIPIVILAIIGGVTLVCLRKRTGQKAEAIAAQNIAQETKMQPTKLGMHSQPSVQPYMAPPPPPGSPPPPAISVSHSPPNHLLPPTSTSSASQPIILGPIGSDSSNGAYLTGIDTSDTVSMTSNTLRPVDNPFSDDNSFTEPPPPYRPHSAAPPSFTTNSRHSSLRVGDLQTRLIEGDPFGDPDNDSVSDLSEPM